MPTITAYVDSIQSHGIASLAKMARVSASYQSSNTISSISFDVPTNEARGYYVGQELDIRIEFHPEPGEKHQRAVAE